jgi:hypothetical protein
VNLRLGFARLARVTAVLYGVASVLIVGFVTKGQWDERQAELHPHMFTISAPSGRVFVVPAIYDWEATSAAEEYDKAHPVVAPAEEPSSNVRDWTDEQLMASAKGQYTTPPWQDYAPPQASAKLSGADIFADPPKKKVPAQKPIRVPVAKYDHPRAPAAIAKAGGMAALWCALGYAVLWAAFRGVRWVALGFMSGGREGA